MDREIKKSGLKLALAGVVGVLFFWLTDPIYGVGRKNFDKSPQLELAAGVAYYGLRRFPEAIEAFLRTIRLDPGIEQPYVFLGRMLDQAEDKLPQITEVFAGTDHAAIHLAGGVRPEPTLDREQHGLVEVR